MSDAFVIESDRLVWRGERRDLGRRAVGAATASGCAPRSATGRRRRLGTAAPARRPTPRSTRRGRRRDVATLTNGRIRVVATASSGARLADRIRRSRDCRLAFHDARRAARCFRRRLRAARSSSAPATYRPLPGGGVRARAALETPRRRAPRRHGPVPAGPPRPQGRDVRAGAPQLPGQRAVRALQRGLRLPLAQPGDRPRDVRDQPHRVVGRVDRQLDYWVTAGATPRTITRRYADATGHAPMMPEHGLGFWQCKLRYWNQERAARGRPRAPPPRAAARRHRRRLLPLAEHGRLPLRGRVLARPGGDGRRAATSSASSSWSRSGRRCRWSRRTSTRCRRRNLLVRTEPGHRRPDVVRGTQPVPRRDQPRGARVPVGSVPRAATTTSASGSSGSTRPSPSTASTTSTPTATTPGQALEVGNLYPQAFSRAFFEGQGAAARTTSSTSCAAPGRGRQRYGALVWSGDIHSTSRRCAGRSPRASTWASPASRGSPRTSAGSTAGDTDDPAFHELLVRWFQFGTFCPVMRLHGDRAPASEVARGGRLAAAADRAPATSCGGSATDVYEILARYVHLREDLRDYTRALMAAAHTDGQPVMRGLFHEFPDDPVGWDRRRPVPVRPGAAGRSRARGRCDVPARLPARGRAWTSPAPARPTTAAGGSTSTPPSPSSRCSRGTVRCTSWWVVSRLIGPSMSGG